MLHVLRSVQVAQLKGDDARRISFRDIDVEQIGYIYEGLLGYSCVRVTDQVILGLIGTAGAEPEIPLADPRGPRRRRTPPRRRSPRRSSPGSRRTSRPRSPPTATQRWPSNLTATDGVEDAADRHLRAVTGGNVTSGPAAALVPGSSAATCATARPSSSPAACWSSRPPPDATPAPTTRRVPWPRKSSSTRWNRCATHPGPHQTADQDEWQLKLVPDEILDLKVADIACGSGAFLVAAARYLAARLVEAWIAEDPDATPTARTCTCSAIRQVVASCLYGADINEMAVEMCKLSLWLVSLDRDLPFSFVDDKIFHGNSLLGLTDLKQLRALHIDPPKDQQTALWGTNMDDVIHRAVEIRRRLATEVDEHDPQRSASAKRRQLVRLQELTAQLRTVADGVIAAGLRLGGKPGRQLNEAYENLREAVNAAYPADGRTPDPDVPGIHHREGLTPTVRTDYDRWKPLHWALEVPDVIVDHGGFDAIIGNPPFLGGQKLTGAMGTNIRDWLVHHLADEAGAAPTWSPTSCSAPSASSIHRQPRADRDQHRSPRATPAKSALTKSSTHGLRLPGPCRAHPWPAASANLEYAAVWGTRRPSRRRPHRIVGRQSRAPRSPLCLEPAGRIDANPRRLARTRTSPSSAATCLGMGFVLDPRQAQQWITEDERNREVLFPYLNGEDLNSRPIALRPAGSSTSMTRPGKSCTDTTTAV